MFNQQLPKLVMLVFSACLMLGQVGSSVAENLQILDPEQVKIGLLAYKAKYPDFIGEYTQQLKLESAKPTTPTSEKISNIGPFEIDLKNYTYRFSNISQGELYLHAPILTWEGKLSLGYDGTVHVLPPTFKRTPR